MNPKTSRPSWDEYGIALAKTAALMSTCRKLDVGAVLINNHTHQVMATGFNGSPPKEPHCLDEGCTEVNNHCINAVHAECNAIDFAEEKLVVLQNCTLYVTHFPCKLCADYIIRKGIRRVVYLHDYKPHGLFIDTDIEVIKI